MIYLKRREWLAGLAGIAVAGLSDWAYAQATAPGFNHGVASGDPLADRVILWTRYRPADGGVARVRYEVATDDAFARIVARGTAQARPERDWTVKVDAAGLAAGGRYFYRFVADGATSPVGRTRTLPRNADSLKIALFSCSNLPFGFFNAYGHAAADDSIDLALHVGDYIYEYQRGKYPSATQVVPGRLIEPVGETISLADYRLRYASYHADPDLQALRAAVPMIAVWDDHESANDTWKDGAQEHDDKTEGPWPVRKRAAEQAYFEWLPIRPRTPGDITTIYRRFDWGKVASLIMLDTRMVGRDKQYDLWQLLEGIDPTDAAAVRARMAAVDPAYRAASRSIMGFTQERWLNRALQDSSSRGVAWQVLTQQLLSIDLKAPVDARKYVRADAWSGSRRWVELTAAVAALGYGWNFDSWTGYPAARARLHEAVGALANNVVSLGGDTHNAWLGAQGKTKEGRPLLVEFAGSSVTSSGMEGTFSDLASLESAVLDANSELKWCNLQDRGYVAVTFTADSATGEYRFVETIRERSLKLKSIQTARVEAAKGSGVGALSFG
jgi:alkaline phosphatase D